MTPLPAASLSSRGLAPARGRVAEVFRSIQGEGALVGRRMVFVRLAGCEIGCRYCDTAWAFDAPANVGGESSGAPGAPLFANPLSADEVAALVAAVDPPGAPGGPAPVALTGGEPCEQAEFALALVRALAPRDVLLETAGLHAAALARLAPRCRWIAADIKLPSACALPDALERHEEVFRSGAYAGLRAPPDGLGPRLFFKLVADGDTGVDEVARVGAMLARYAPEAPVFLQPVTPLGGSPVLPRERLEALVDALAAAGREVRVIPQVHKALRVR